MATPTTTTPQPPPVIMLTMDVVFCSETEKNQPDGTCITSDAVGVGGHTWCICFYPNGWSANTTNAASVSLRRDFSAGEGVAEDDDVHLEFKFMRHKIGGGGPPSFVSSRFRKSFSRRKKTEELILERFVPHEDLAKSVFADGFMIRCDLAISPPSTGTKASASAGVDVPPRPPFPAGVSGLSVDLGRLLETKEGADVEFEVRGQQFAAHKIVLGARSPVFKEDFFGPVKKEKTTSNIRIIDMNPEAFKAPLHYMYTDTLPEMSPMKSREEMAALAEDLLLPADRYNLKDMKTLADKVMCNRITARTAMPMLVLAEQHQLHKLKMECIKFIVSHNNTRATMETDDVEHLARSCPSVVKEVIAKILDTSEDQTLTFILTTILFAFHFIIVSIVLFFEQRLRSFI